jgi:hypothetical protein
MQQIEEYPHPPVWDLYREAKAAKEAQDWPLMLRTLSQLAQADPAQRQSPRLGNAVGWLIHYAGKFYLSLSPPDPQSVLTLLSLARAFVYEATARPSAYAMLLRLALKTRKQNPDFLAFMAWWDLAQLQAEDYERYTPPGGQSLPALAEQALLGIGKHLLAGYTEAGQLPQGSYDQAAMARYIDTLGAHIAARPDYEFLPYVRAQLYLALNQPEAALTDLRPFVRKHVQQPWAWDWLGRAYHRLGQGEAARACLARALSARAPEAVTVLTRERYGRLCLADGDLAEAKAAFERVAEVRWREWGKLPQRLQAVMEAPWYAETAAALPAAQQLSTWAAKAQRFLQEDLPEELAVVTAVHPGKQLAWFRLDRERSGNLRGSMLSASVRPGDRLRLRVQARQGQEEVWYEALSARLTDEPAPSGLSQSLRGRLMRVPGQAFGFVANEAFVPPPLMTAHQAQVGQVVQALTIAEYDRKRKRWGWQVLRIEE